MAKNIILETKRLYLREFMPEDIADLAEILQDDRVMYAYEHDFSDNDVKIWLDRQQKRYKKYGHGLWAVVQKDTGKIVGQAGLTYQDCEGEQVLEVGYLLKYKFWHRGYAKEAAEACIDYAFNVLGENKVAAIIKTDNRPSQKVAEAVGMVKKKVFMAEYYNGEMAHYLFFIERGKNKW